MTVNKSKTQNGFTLVELAIAMMIIGLLIGGVLKGQELIENARVTRVIRDLTDYDTAVMIFRNTYNGLPGDYRTPSRIPNCTGNCLIINAATAGNMRLDTVGEYANFWRHLHAAGLVADINAAPTDYTDISPRTAFNGHIMTIYFPNETNDQMLGNIYQPYSSDASGIRRLAMYRSIALDIKMDDGLPKSGRIRVGNPECKETASNAYLVTAAVTTGCQTNFYSNTMNDRL